MQKKLTLILAAVLSASCAAHPANVKCDGEVFFVKTGCREVAAATRPVAPAPKTASTAAQPLAEPVAPVASVTPMAPTTSAVATAEPAAPPQVNTVYFGTGSADITKDAKAVLDPIVDYLKQSPDEKVSLYAFADPTGTLTRNNKLLDERNKAVQQYFAAAGIAEGRVEISKDSRQIMTKAFPASSYWTLRKVLVNYSSKALAATTKHEAADDAESESDAIPAAAKTRTAAATPKSSDKVADKTGDKVADKTGDKVADKTGDKTTPDGLEKIDVMYWKSTNHALLLVAKSMGYFRDEGFDVRLHEAGTLEANQMSIAIAEGVGTVRAPASAVDIKRKKYFMGAVCPLGLHDAIAKNIPLVQIGGMLANPNTLIMRKELSEKMKKNLSAFEGKIVAKNQHGPSNIDYTDLFTNQLKANHVNYKEKFFGSFGATAEAVVRGEADAALSTPPYDQQIIDQHPELGIYQLSTLYSHLPCCRQLVTREQLRDKKTRDKYVRFERALIRAHKYYKENKAETSELVAKILKLPPTLVRQVFSRPGYDLDPNPNLKGSIAFYNTLKDSIGKQDVRESIDTSVYQEALLALSKENPVDDYYKSAVREYRLTN